MDTDASADQRELLDVSRRFMENSCPLRAVRDGVWRDGSFAASYRRQGAELGWFSMFVPESLGGGSISGNGALDAALIAYHRGRGLQPGSFVGTNVVAAALAAAGSDELRAAVLPALISGEASASWAATSSGGGGRVENGVHATSRADGSFELHGKKAAVQDIDPSTWLLVTCGTADGPMQSLVPADAAGVSVTPLASLDLTRRFAEVAFDGVHVPATAVVGEPGTCGALIERQRAIACTLIAAEMVGAMDQDFETTVQYAKDRIAFGRPIGSFQGLKHQLADTSLALEMSKAIAVAAARTVGTDGDEHGPQAASMAKAFVSEAGIDLVQTCFQVYGGIGYTWEHDQHLFLRRITMDAGLFGDGAWHREHLCQLAGL
ncbi:MAG: acyl-CoA dehydrogenase protein [Ilumatobacteraceae bacterium]|nr:acyl-CoA dehydrogenase protein [Ilumatobacteraceae bacterium]